MANSKSTLAQRSVSTVAPSIRVERSPHDWYKVTGSRAELVAAGVACTEWFPQGRKRTAHGGKFEIVDNKCSMTGSIQKHAGDCFELRFWHVTDAHRKLLDSLMPAEPIVPPTPEEIAREQAEAVECWGHMLECAWRMSSNGKDYRLAERDQERFLEALRTARAILNTATIVNVKQEQAALSVARQDQTFQQFMLEQGLRDHAAT